MSDSLNFVHNVINGDKYTIDNDPVNSNHILNSLRQSRRSGKLFIHGKTRMNDAIILENIINKSLQINTHFNGISNDPEKMIEHIAKLNINWSFDESLNYIKRRSPYFDNNMINKLETIWNINCSQNKRVNSRSLFI